MHKTAEPILQIEEKVKAFIDAHQMLPSNGRIVVGVSGGADSMALLHFLLQSLEHPGRLLAVHVNHGLRGAAADSDEAYVRSWCEQHAVSFRSVHADVSRLAAKRKCSEETCGREVRYAAFAEFASAFEDRIATADRKSVV